MSPQSAFRRPLMSLALGAGAALLASSGALAAPVAAETTAPPPSASTTSAPAAPGAATVYRSWGFYQLKDGAWAFAQTGPYSVAPAEGSVDGWRLATSDMTTPRLPRSTPSFDDVCGKTAGEAGKKRVGVVVDYGRPSDGPEGANPPAPIARCAIVPSAASSSEILSAVALPRDDKGMVCAIDNYPAGTECAVKLNTMPEAAKAPDEKVDITVTAAREQPKPVDPSATPRVDEGPSKTLLTGIAVVIVAAAGAGAYVLRRRKSA